MFFMEWQAVRSHQCVGRRVLREPRQSTRFMWICGDCLEHSQTLYLHKVSN